MRSQGRVADLGGDENLRGKRQRDEGRGKDEIRLSEEVHLERKLVLSPLEVQGNRPWTSVIVPEPTLPDGCFLHGKEEESRSSMGEGASSGTFQRREKNILTLHQAAK